MNDKEIINLIINNDKGNNLEFVEIVEGDFYHNTNMKGYEQIIDKGFKGVDITNTFSSEDNFGKQSHLSDKETSIVYCSLEEDNNYGSECIIVSGKGYKFKHNGYDSELGDVYEVLIPLINIESIYSL